MQDPLELEHVIGFTGQYPHTLVAHPATNNCFIYPIGSVVVIGDLNDPHNQRFLRKHDEQITSICVSSTGRYLASGQLGTTKQKGNIARIFVWDLQQEKAVYELKGHSGIVTHLSFSHDDRFLASTGDQKLCIWDMENGKLAGGSRLDKSASFVTFFGKVANFNPKRPRYQLAAGPDDHFQIIDWYYDVRTMSFEIVSSPCSLPGRVTGMKREYFDAALDSSNTYCYAGTRSGEVIVFNTEYKIFKNSIQVSSNGIFCVCLKGNDTIYVGAGDGTVKQLHGSNYDFRIVKEVQLNGEVTSLALLADGKYLVAGTNYGKIYKINTDTLQEKLIAESCIGPVTSVSFFSESNDFFCTCSHDGSLRMWDLSDYSVKAMMTGPSKATCCINLGDQILSGWTDGFIRMYDVKSQVMKWQINAHRGGVTCLAYCNKFICSGGEDSIIRLWSTVNQELIAQYSEHTKPVTDILIDIDHPHLLHSCSIDKTVSTFDLKIGRRITFHALQKHNDRGFMSISQRLDHEKEVVTAGIDGKIRFWDIDYPNQVDVLEDSNSCLNTIAVSPSGRFIAVGGDDALVKVWNLQTKKIISVGICHSSKVNCVKWSPDEKQLISVGE